MRPDPSRVVASRADYVLQPQDVLRIFVFQHDDINKQCEAISISQEHTITLPLISTINLKGKTARQAEALIRELYDRDFLVNPQVNVTVVKYGERFVNVVGAVNKPDRIPFPTEGGLTIVDAITAAGGPNRYADLKKVTLTRIGANGEATTREVNVDAMMKPGGPEAIHLERDDTIRVLERVL